MQRILYIALAIFALARVQCAPQPDADQLYVRTQSTRFDSPIVNVVWCGSQAVISDEFDLIFLEPQQNAKKVLFVLTDAGNVYSSDDDGFTFENATKTWQTTFSREKLVPEDLVINTMQVSPADAQIIFFFGNNGHSFYSQTCGDEYAHFTHSRDLSNFRLNREKKDHILALEPEACAETPQIKSVGGKRSKKSDTKGSDADTLSGPSYDDYPCDSTEKRLVVSRDFGAQWSVALKHVLDASWDKLLHYSVVPDERIIALHRVRDHAQKHHAVRQWVPVVSYSDDFYASHEVVEYNAVQFFQTDTYFFILTEEQGKGADDDGQARTQQLKMASAYIGEYRPQDIKFPLANSKENAFTLLDSSDGFIQIAVNHHSNDAPFANLYLSDFLTSEFTLSLMHMVRDRDGRVDCDKVHSMEGVYIANVYENTAVERFLSKSSRKNIQNNKDSETRYQGTKSSQAELSQLNMYKKTLITYDYGANWRQLKAPEIDVNGQALHCSGECSLHLRGRTEVIGNPIYSSKEAPGIIIATGNVGTYLNANADVSTFFSRDGGHTWEMIQDHSHIYELADHGGLIVTAKDTEPTTEIQYTWDEGLTWNSTRVSDGTLDVENVMTEPTNMAKKFVVVARTHTASEKPVGVLVAVDFKTLKPRICSGAWEPYAPDSDYEYWQPENYAGDKCVFGQRVKYVRRKRTAQCFNSEEYDKKSIVDFCECTEDDWECDFGFRRENGLNGACVPISDEYAALLDPAPPADCRYAYVVTHGYRKLLNFCYGGVDHSPEYLPCPVVIQEVTQDTSEDVYATQSVRELEDGSNDAAGTLATSDSAQGDNSVADYWLHFIVVALLVGGVYACRRAIVGGMSKIVDLFRQREDVLNRRYEELRQKTESRSTRTSKRGSGISSSSSGSGGSGSSGDSSTRALRSNQPQRVSQDDNDDQDDEESQEGNSLLE